MLYQRGLKILTFFETIGGVCNYNQIFLQSISLPFFRKKVTLQSVSVHVSLSVVQRGKPLENQMISIPMELFASLQQTKVRYPYDKLLF